MDLEPTSDYHAKMSDIASDHEKIPPDCRPRVIRTAKKMDALISSHQALEKKSDQFQAQMKAFEAAHKRCQEHSEQRFMNAQELTQHQFESLKELVETKNNVASDAMSEMRKNLRLLIASVVALGALQVYTVVQQSVSTSNAIKVEQHGGGASVSSDEGPPDMGSMP